MSNSCLVLAKAKAQRLPPEVEEVLNPVCCHGNKAARLMLQSTFSRIIMQGVKFLIRIN